MGWAAISGQPPALRRCRWPARTGEDRPKNPIRAFESGPAAIDLANGPALRPAFRLAFRLAILVLAALVSPLFSGDWNAVPSCFERSSVICRRQASSRADRLMLAGRVCRFTLSGSTRTEVPMLPSF